MIKFLQNGDIRKVKIEEGQVIEFCFERYGDISPYVIDEIKNTHRDGNDAMIRNSKYVILRKIDPNETLEEKTDEEGNIIWKVKK